MSHAQLLTHPQDYEGYTVMIGGYIRERGGSLNVYQVKEDALTNNKAASIWIEDERAAALAKGPCSDQYVTVSGPFGVLKTMKFHGVTRIDRIWLHDIEDGGLKKTPCF